MKRILIVLVIVALFLCGCGKKETEETQQRFAIEYQQMFTWGSLSIIRDTETGKAYLFVQRHGYAGGLATLEEAE